MKKALFLLAAAFAAFSCTNIEVADYQSEEIGFEVASYSVQTRAHSAFTGASFGVYAWYDAANNGAQHQAFMQNVEISKVTEDQTTSVWKSATTKYYWPKTGNIDFIAYYPYASTPWMSIADVDPLKANQINGTTTGIVGTEDFMYASKAVDQTKNADPATYYTVGVPTLFHHALAQVAVAVKATTLGSGDNVWTITLDNAYFDDMAYAGTVQLGISSETAGVNEWTLPTNAIWTASAATQDITITDTAVNVTATATTVLDYRTVLPQALADKKIHLEFTIKSFNDGGITPYATEKVVKDVLLTDFSNNIAYWQMNKKILYTIILAPSGDEILFDPAVVDWDSVDAGSISL